MKNERRHGRMLSLIKRLSAEFLLREAGIQSLVTVTNAVLSEDNKCATIFLTAYPETQEAGVLLFSKRKAGEIRNYIKEHARIGQIPFLKFEIDRGEKNRRRIEELSKE